MSSWILPVVPPIFRGRILWIPEPTLEKKPETPLGRFCCSSRYSSSSLVALVSSSSTSKLISTAPPRLILFLRNCGNDCQTNARQLYNFKMSYAGTNLKIRCTLMLILLNCLQVWVRSILNFECFYHNLKKLFCKVLHVLSMTSLFVTPRQIAHFRSWCRARIISIPISSFGNFPCRVVFRPLVVSTPGPEILVHCRLSI